VTNNFKVLLTYLLVLYSYRRVLFVYLVTGVLKQYMLCSDMKLCFGNLYFHLSQLTYVIVNCQEQTLLNKVCMVLGVCPPSSVLLQILRLL